MRWTPGALLIHERNTPYLLKWKYRGNGNSAAAWVYTFIVVVISSFYFLVSSIFLSLWNRCSIFLSFLSIRVVIFSASKCPDNFDCSSLSLILDCEEPVIFVKFLKSPLGFPTGKQRAPTVAGVCNEFDWGDIARILGVYRNDTWAWKIVDSVFHSHPPRYTSVLVQMVSEFIPNFANKGRNMGKMATLVRVFQSMRVIVNKYDAAL